MTGDWRDRGLCKETDPEAFFPEKGGSTRPARQVCMGCDVRAECLEWAVVTNELYGVWGGTTEHERRKLRQARGLTGQRVAAA